MEITSSNETEQGTFTICAGQPTGCAHANILAGAKIKLPCHKNHDQLYSTAKTI
jgi:hypothetical protein